MRESFCGIFMDAKRFGQASSMANLRMPCYGFGMRREDTQHWQRVTFGRT